MHSSRSKRGASAVESLKASSGLAKVERTVKPAIHPSGGARPSAGLQRTGSITTSSQGPGGAGSSSLTPALGEWAYIMVKDMQGESGGRPVKP